MIRLQVREGPNVHDQIAFYAFHSLLDGGSPKECWATYVLCMCSKNLEMIAGFSGHLQ